MNNPKDPEVVDEMRAAGAVPEESTPDEGTGGGKKSGKRKRGGKKAGAAAEAETADAAAEAADGTQEKPAAEGTAAEDASFEEPGAEDVAQDDHGPDELREILIDEHAEEHAHRSPAATALMVLVGVIVVAVGTLWVAPRVAPHVPAGIGKYLMPGQMDTAAEIAALRSEIADTDARAQDRIAAIGGRVDAAEAALATASGLPEAMAAAGQAADAAAEALALARDAGAEAQALGARLGQVETGLAELRDNVAAVNAALTGGDGAEASPAQLTAAVAAMNARIESLSAAAADRATTEALAARLDDLGTRLDAIEGSAAAAAGIQEKALVEVAAAIRQASLRTAATTLSSQVEVGQPYAAALAEVVALTGADAPGPLAAGAEAGLATPETLGASFGPFAQAAIAADVKARAGDGTGSQVVGWLRAQVTGRPVTEQEGEGVAATTSRIAARVRDTALDEALAEAESLPPPAQAALGDWLERLRARVEAQAALAAWLAEIGVNG
ncbi:MAG TPA: hypothetical protein VLA52_14870 [Thermohalobaculum sp.]|nr:hypothetical protein [Thermohalobaculum sp.]